MEERDKKLDELVNLVSYYIECDRKERRENRNAILRAISAILIGIVLAVLYKTGGLDAAFFGALAGYFFFLLARCI